MPPCFYVSLGFEHYKCCGHHVMWGVFMIKRDVFGYLPYDHIESLSLEKGFKNNTLKWQAKIQSKKKVAHCKQASVGIHYLIVYKVSNISGGTCISHWSTKQCAGKLLVCCMLSV